MIYDIQKASMWKRISASLLDVILLGIVSVGFIFMFSWMTNYDDTLTKMDAVYLQYKEEYGFDFREVTEEMYDKYTDEQKEYYDNTYQIFIKDEEVLRVHNLMVSKTTMMVALGVLMGFLIVEFLVPLVLKNGQTIGKKCFSICVISENGVRIKPFVLFIRTILGKYTIETMISVFLIISMIFGSITIVKLFIILALIVANLTMIITNRNNALIHDVLAYTVVVDKESQLIFENQDELIEYKQKIALEKANSQKTFK